MSACASEPLREPDRVNSRQQHRPERDRGHAHHAHRQPPHRQQPKRGNHQHGFARHLGIVARNFPPQRQINAGQRRMGVAQRSGGNQRAGAKQIPRRRNVVASLVPVIRQSQKRKVAGVKRHEDHGEDHPDRQRAIHPRAQDSFQAQGLAPRLCAIFLPALIPNPAPAPCSSLTIFSSLQSLAAHCRPGICNAATRPRSALIPDPCSLIPASSLARAESSGSAAQG